MSAGAVFKLIANDGKADKLITASELLKNRLVDISCERRSRGMDPTPLLTDIEKTHVLYVNSHFKPHAAIGFEYNKCRPTSGTSALGMSVQFSIPQYGDFFNDMVVRTRLGAVTAKSGVLSTLNTDFGTDLVLNDNSKFDVVDPFGHVLAPVASSGTPSITYTNFVRYCQFPGNRLFESVKFEVNGNPLDEYTYMVPVMQEKFEVPLNKRIGYNRLCGQEVPRAGFGALSEASVVDRIAASTSSLGISAADPKQSNQTVAFFQKVAVATSDYNNPSLVGVTAPSALSANHASTTDSTQYDVCRQQLQFLNGPQTPKPVQPPLELWTSLCFWFNKDVSDSIASVSIPFGMRFITIQLAQQNELVYEYPSIYLRTTHTSGVHANTVTNAAGPTTTHSIVPLHYHNGINDVSIELMEMYINNIFVNPEIHDIFIQRITFSLVRVYRQQQVRVTASDERQLNQIKWPVEYMYVGIRPTFNVLGTTGSTTTAGSGADLANAVTVSGVQGNPEKWQDWHRFSYNPQCVTAATSEVTGYFQGTGKKPVQDFHVSTSAVTATTYSAPVSTIDTLSLSAHGIPIYDSFTDVMFNQYIPYAFGGCAINSPEDTGVMLVNMALFPGQKQPSGHLNVSRARETFLKFSSTYLSPATPGDLFIVANCINFLLISDGSAVLRFST